MKLYNCLIALGMNQGTVNPHHEVPKMAITRAEVVVLRGIHGKEAVKNIEPVGETPEGVSDMDVYRTLAQTYPPRLIESLFGVVLLDLDSDLDGEDLEEGLEPREPVLIGGRPAGEDGDALDLGGMPQVTRSGRAAARAELD